MVAADLRSGGRFGPRSWPADRLAGVARKTNIERGSAEVGNARKTDARKARRAINRGDRVKATPETLAKLRPHPLELLLARGREGGGIDADQWQGAEEIEDAAQAIAPASGYASADLEAVGHSAATSLMSPR